MRRTVLDGNCSYYVKGDSSNVDPADFTPMWSILNRRRPFHRRDKLPIRHLAERNADSRIIHNLR